MNNDPIYVSARFYMTLAKTIIYTYYMSFKRKTSKLMQLWGPQNYEFQKLNNNRVHNIHLLQYNTP